MLSFNRIYRFLDQALFVVLFFLIMGVPLIFSTDVRAVFEPVKLLWMRGGILIAGLLYLIRNIVEMEDPDQKILKKYRGISVFKFKKSILDIPIILWISSLAFSTLTSQNVLVSFYGSYDRWEGLLNSLFYVALFSIFFKFSGNKT